MKFDTIHHVALICSDYKASRHFYVDLLGFEIIRENYRENRGDYKLINGKVKSWERRR